MPAKADGPRAPKNRNAASNAEVSPNSARKQKAIMTSSFGTLLASFLLQGLNLVPADLHAELITTQVAITASALLYLVLPRKAKITFEWER